VTIIVLAVGLAAMADAEDAHDVVLEGEQDAVVADTEAEGPAMSPCSGSMSPAPVRV
jgi:hypothetical protein